MQKAESEGHYGLGVGAHLYNLLQNTLNIVAKLGKLSLEATALRGFVAFDVYLNEWSQGVLLRSKLCLRGTLQLSEKVHALIFSDRSSLIFLSKIVVNSAIRVKHIVLNFERRLAEL